MNEEYVTVLANGMVFDGFEQVRVTAAINEAVREFQIETTELPGEFKFPPGTAIEIRSNGDLLVKGYVNTYQTSGEAKSHQISIKGRGKGQDFVDSSAEHDTGNFEDKDAGEIAAALDRYGIGIKSKIKLDRVPYWQLAPGETAFQTIERILRQEGATMMGEADGSISIVNASVAEPHFGMLIEGQNIKSWQVSLTDGSKHSNYIVKGQNRRGTGSAALRIREEARDGTVRRNRQRVILSETDTTSAKAKKRAQHEKERAAGKSIKASVQVQGFRDIHGKIYQPNKTIYVYSPILMHLVREMLIERVEFSQHNRSGSLTQLTLVDPRAYKGKSAGDRQRSKSAIEDEADTGRTDNEATTDQAWEVEE